MNSNHSIFKLIENDIFNIMFDDVMSILLKLRVITVSGRTKYHFPYSVDVQEA